MNTQQTGESKQHQPKPVQENETTASLAKDPPPVHNGGTCDVKEHSVAPSRHPVRESTKENRPENARIYKGKRQGAIERQERDWKFM